MSCLLACKHLTEMGLDPTVFEFSNSVGGVWSQTIESTKLQTPKSLYQFSDFEWPDSVGAPLPWVLETLAITPMQTPTTRMMETPIPIAFLFIAIIV
ncbi:unnamed protein product [Linum trigynum]|uniref:Flavin-containing monooxygenase n=1 Tax=Linum trigynum TaxID=586398 RepID=A0AAV2FNN3_9ROSI